MMFKTLEKELMVETLEKGDKLRFKALGGSMTPFIRSGDIITIEPVNHRNIVVGDILFYEADSEFLVHRLIEKRENKENSIYTTKGDSLTSPDKPVNDSQIMGKVIKIERNGKKLEYGTRYWKLMNYLFTKIPIHVMVNIYMYFHKLTNSK